jgi:hypothetical protein
MGDIIDLKARRKGAGDSEDKAVLPAELPILDITPIREEQIKSDRREAKRTILHGFIGASVLIPGRGLLKVSLFDISKGGLSFDLPTEAGHFREGEEVAVRFYFSHNVYFPFVVRVTSIRLSTEMGIARHGSTFSQDPLTLQVLHHFIDFLEAVATDLKTDKGDLFISGFGL